MTSVDLGANPLHASADHRSDRSSIAGQNPRHPERRGGTKNRGLLNRRTILTAGILAGFGSAMAGEKLDEPVSVSETISLPRFTADPSRPVRVRMEMELHGNVNVAKDPLVDRKIDLQLPLDSDAVLDFEEFADDRGLAMRFYHQAGCDWRIDGRRRKTRLRDEVRFTRVNRTSLPETIFSPADYMTRDEVDLLKTPVCSLAIDGLIPEKIEPNDEPFFPSLEAVAAALNLSSAQSSDVSVRLVAVDEETLRFQLDGTVEGSAAGVPTEQKVVGKLAYDRNRQLVSWAAIAIHERRTIGVAEPGFDISATIKMLRRPMDAAVGLVKHPASRTDGDPMMVEIESKMLRVAAMMDRRWQPMTDVSGHSVWRMTENDRSVAQVDLRTLPTLQSGQSWTLEDFVRDVTKTLGTQMDQILDRKRSISSSGLEVMTVTATGKAGDVDVRWTLVHLADTQGKSPTGRRVQATFTLQSDAIDAFAGSEQQLASSLRFLDTPIGLAVEPGATSDQSGSDSSPEADLKAERPESRKRAALQSMSDRR